MTRSTEFGTTIKRGRRAAQHDLVVHLAHGGAGARRDDGPRVGLVIPKSVGNAVERHRVARRLRHVARIMIDDLAGSDRLVIRALPGSRSASSARLAEQVRSGVRRAAAGAKR